MDNIANILLDNIPSLFLTERNRMALIMIFILCGIQPEESTEESTEESKLLKQFTELQKSIQQSCIVKLTLDNLVYISIQQFIKDVLNEQAQSKLIQKKMMQDSKF